MQAQHAAQTLDLQKSQAYVETLLQTSLASITFLRNLFSADNFGRASLTSERSSESFSTSIDEDYHAKHKGSTASQFKVTTLIRGFTEEADRLLDYLENGIFEAMRLQYLKSFIFAIYLDPKDPNNVVEAYTFNFTYFNVPGTDVVVPILSLEEQFERASLRQPGKCSDPVIAASKQGRQPTLGEVKKSLRLMLRRLIQATSQMEPLPARRYATFKLFYYAHTPADYEPPNFRAGDVDRDKWYFTTHDREEVPEKWSVGTLETPFHSVGLRIASVVSHIPSMDNNNAPFTGTIASPDYTHAPLSSAQDLALKTKQIDLQMHDAEQRNMAWDAEDGLFDEDAEGVDDEECIASLKASGLDGKQGSGGLNDSGIAFVKPIGMRNEHGAIEPLSSQTEIRITGAREGVPQRVGLMNKATNPGAIAQTQKIFPTQNCSQPTRPLTDGGIESQSALCASIGTNIDTQSLMRDMLVGDDEIDTEMLDTDTQLISACTPDPIKSFGENMDMDTIPKRVIKPSIELKAKDSISCECHVDIEDDACLCEGQCGRWYHLWCMGYHSTLDKRIPKVFICFDCRIRSDQNWLMLKDEAYPQMLQKFQDLALFRRAIKIAELNNGPESVTKFTKLIGCETRVAAAMFKRLESEGFIASEIVTTDQFGILETKTRTIKGKNKGKTKQRKNIQKTTYSFVATSKRTAAYADYFNPLSQVEKKLSGLADVEATFRQRWKTIRGPLAAETPFHDESVVLADPKTMPSQKIHTSDIAVAMPIRESQDAAATTSAFASVSHAELKRKSMDTLPPNKKVKISVATPIDLQD